MTPSITVRRRHVFYVSGFDPNGPSRYHKLYRDGAQRQAAAGGAVIEVGARVRVDAQTMAWQVHYQAPHEKTEEPQPVETSYVFPRWDDIIRAYWWHGNGPQVRDLLKTSWLYARTGALWQMYRQCWGPFIHAFGPLSLLVLLLPGVAATLWACFALVRAASAGAPLATPLACTAVLGMLALTWAYWARRHWHSRWILRTYAFTGRMGRDRKGVPGLDERLDTMAAAVCKQVQRAEDDEVLIVGHSLGSIMAVSVLARAFQRDPQLFQHGPAIGLVTLGHCTPLLSDLPAAQAFRDELAVLAQAPGLCWVDFTDPLDAYGFAGVDPVAAAGIQAPRDGHPQMLSPGFSRLFGPGPDQVRHMGLHDIHAQYLCASTAGNPYDYFAMTAGPLTLAERYRPAA